jgi:hypothetical protein
MQRPKSPRNPCPGSNSVPIPASAPVSVIAPMSPRLVGNPGASLDEPDPPRARPRLHQDSDAFPGALAFSDQNPGNY